MDTVGVMLVDDQLIVRRGLATIIKYAPGIEVVAEAANGREALERAERTRPDVVLMDLKMPILGGIPAIRELSQRFPDVHVIILTTYDDDELVYDGIRAGAEGYLLKDASSEELLGAIRDVMRGESRLDPKVAAKVLAGFRDLASTSQGERNLASQDLYPVEALTDREHDVLQLLAQGLSNSEIASRLYLSEGTVKNYVSEVMDKLQVSNRTQAVIRALRLGLVDI